MSHILITSDIHFGVPNKLEHSLWAAKVMREYAAKNNIEVVLVAGDLFHDRTSLSIPVLNTAYDFFNETNSKYNQEWVAFPGNHDMHMRNSWEVNSVRPLNKLITIIEGIKAITACGIRFWILPFIHYETAYMQAVRAIETKASESDILLTHIGINNAKLNECFLLKYWNLVNFSDTKFRRIYSGHFHCYQQVGEKTWYPGSPIPFRFDEGLVEHGFLDFDTEAMDHKFIKIFEAGKELLPDLEPAPDYLTCVDDHVGEIIVTNNNIRVLLSKEYTNNELQNLRESIMARGARSVKWMKPKQEEDDTIVHISKSNVADGIQLFDQWLKHDDPTIDVPAITELNKTIVDEGLERIASEELNGDTAD